MPLAQDTGRKALQGLSQSLGRDALEVAVPSGQRGLHKVVVKAEAAPGPGPGGARDQVCNPHLQGSLEQLAAEG